MAHDRIQQFWTDEEDAELIRLRKEGYTFTAAARWMKKTKNQLVGRAVRLRERGVYIP